MHLRRRAEIIVTDRDVVIRGPEFLESEFPRVQTLRFIASSMVNE
jgi:hypothetical protein